MTSRVMSARGGKSPSGEAEAVHRSFKINRVDPHPKRKAILLHGHINVSIIGIGAMTHHDSIAEDTREFRKVIRLDSLNESSNANEIVDEILAECPYIVEQEVIDLLFTAIDYIQRRNYDANGVVVNGRGKSAYQHLNDDEADDEEDEFSSRSNIPPIFDDEDMTTAIESGDTKEISMDELETYIELLYEEKQDKAKGAYCISKLVTTSENLIIIFNHESATNALFRTLREEYKKSLDLTTNILRIVEQFAEYNDFHQHLLSHKISSLMFEIIEYELDVYEQWQQEILAKQAEVDNNSQRSSASNSNSKTAGGDNNLSQLSKKQIKAQMQLDKFQIRFDELAIKQDNLLLVAFKILKYLRVSIPIEELHKKDLVKLLVTCLDRKNSSLLTVIIDFLAILSAYHECKNQMLKCGVIDTVQPYLVTSVQAVDEFINHRNSGHNYHEYEAQMKTKMSNMNSVLIVLFYNLSFDTKSRLKMAKYGILQRAAQLFDNGDKMLQQKCVLLLYNFSMDRKNRPKFAATNLVQKILKEIQSTTDDNSMNLYFIAILLNLATSKRCSQIIFKNGGLALLVGWAFRTENHLTMKIVRKLAEHDQTILGVSTNSGGSGGSQVQNEFVHYISDIANAIGKASSTEFIIECIGTLGNLNIPELDFKKLLQQCRLLSWIKNVISKPLPVRNSVRKTGEPRTTDETLFIEIAIFLSTCVDDLECAKYILQDELTSSYLLALCDNSVKIDLDIQIQVLYVFYKICRHQPLLQTIVTTSKIPDTMFKLLQNDYNQLREMAEAILDLIGEYNSEWSVEVKQEKFTAYNHHWLEMVNRPQKNSDDLASGRPSMLRRPASAMRRAPSASGYRPDQGQGQLRQNSSRIGTRSGAKDSSSDTPTIRSETTTSDDESGDENDEDDEIDFEEDDEQVSKQKLQQQNRAGAVAAGQLNDSLETRNIFERFQHQFQQERDARERHEFYHSGGMLSDPDNDNDLYFNDDDDDIHEHANGGINSSDSDILPIER